MADIKNLLNDIIHDTDNSFPDKHDTNYTPSAAFDKNDFREKIAMNVLKDIISAMMHDETKDLDGMIDASIKRHIDTNYNGSCYNYLCKSCGALRSPMLGSIIQEINNKTEEVAEQVAVTKNCPDCVTEAELKTKELLEACGENANYDEFRDRLRDKVSKDVVEEVADVIDNGNDVADFENVDKAIVKSDKDKEDPNKESENRTEEPKTESKIIRMCGSIIQEAALNHQPMSVEEGLNKAIIEYCIVQMDRLFLQKTNIDGYSRYLKY